MRTVDAEIHEREKGIQGMRRENAVWDLKIENVTPKLDYGSGQHTVDCVLLVYSIHDR